MAIVQHEPEELEPSLEGKPSLDKRSDLSSVNYWLSGRPHFQALRSWDKLTVKTAIGIGLFVISVFSIAIIFDDGSSAAGLPDNRSRGMHLHARTIAAVEYTCMQDEL